MKAPNVWKWVPTLMVCSVLGLAGMASAKLPAPSEEAKAKAAEAKAKADEAAKKDGENLGKAQDRVADRYKKQNKTASAGATKVAEKKK
jgi:hypothetical protein